MIEKIEISEVDKLTMLWQKLNTHFDQRLETLRLQNDKPQSEIETAALRGRIAEIKSFYELTKEYPIV